MLQRDPRPPVLIRCFSPAATSFLLNHGARALKA
jgi:hypothetical protein